MNYQTKWAGFALVAFLSGGCGTAHNLNSSSGWSLPVGPGQESPPTPSVTRVYGGVREDYASLTGMKWNDEYSFLNLFFIPLYLVDLPLSAVGDTLTLPLSIGAEVTSSINNYYFPPKSPKSEGPPPDPQSESPHQGNAFAPLAGNKLISAAWTQRRIDMPVAANAP